MAYKIEFGPRDDRKVRLGLKTTSVMGRYDALIAAGEPDVQIRSSAGEVLDPNQLRLDLRSGWGK